MPRTLILIPALLLLAFGVAVGQTVTSQEISGVVQDASGSVIPNVTVTVKNVDTGLLRTVKTNENGFYVASNLTIGTYEVSVEATGFKQSISKGIVLDVNSKLSVNPRLEV